MPRCARHFPASGKQSFKYFGFDEYKQEPRPHPPLSLSSLQEKIEPGIFAIRFLFFYFRVSEFFLSGEGGGGKRASLEYLCSGRGDLRKSLTFQFGNYRTTGDGVWAFDPGNFWETSWERGSNSFQGE